MLEDHSTPIAEYKRSVIINQLETMAVSILTLPQHFPIINNRSDIIIQSQTLASLVLMGVTKKRIRRNAMKAISTISVIIISLIYINFNYQNTPSIYNILNQCTKGESVQILYVY